MVQSVVLTQKLKVLICVIQIFSDVGKVKPRFPEAVAPNSEYTSAL